LYSVKQKESVNDVVINPDLSSEQQDKVRLLLKEYKEMYQKSTLRCTKSNKPNRTQG